MHEIILIDDIKRRAWQAVEAGDPITACPYPANTPAAQRWLYSYLARRDVAMEASV